MSTCTFCSEHVPFLLSTQNCAWRDIYMYLSYLLSAQNCAWPHKSRGTTPHFFWQYWFLIRFVKGSTGNMSVILLLPAGRWISVQACNKINYRQWSTGFIPIWTLLWINKFKYIVAEILKPYIILLYIILYRIHPKTWMIWNHITFWPRGKNICIQVCKLRYKHFLLRSIISKITIIR